MPETDPPADGASLKSGSSTSTVKPAEDTDQAKETLYFIKCVHALFVCLFIRVYVDLCVLTTDTDS